MDARPKSMSSLAHLPCTDRTPLSPEDMEVYLSELSDDWRLEEGKLVSEQSFSSYLGGISFVNLLAGIAEKLDHHPNLFVGYRKVRIEIYTHSANGLTKCDFILAARVDVAKNLL